MVKKQSFIIILPSPPIYKTPLNPSPDLIKTNIYNYIILFKYLYNFHTLKQYFHWKNK